MSRLIFFSGGPLDGTYREVMGYDEQQEFEEGLSQLKVPDRKPDESLYGVINEATYKRTETMVGDARMFVFEKSPPKENIPTSPPTTTSKEEPTKMEEERRLESEFRAAGKRPDGSG